MFKYLSQFINFFDHSQNSKKKNKTKNKSKLRNKFKQFKN